MDEPFSIPVIYKGKEYEFEAQLHATSYHYRIEVSVNEILFSFERDDEGNFRAIAVKPDDNRIQKADPALLQAIANAIQEILS